MHALNMQSSLGPNSILARSLIKPSLRLCRVVWSLLLLFQPEERQTYSDELFPPKFINSKHQCLLKKITKYLRLAYVFVTHLRTSRQLFYRTLLRQRQTLFTTTRAQRVATSPRTLFHSRLQSGNRYRSPFGLVSTTFSGQAALVRLGPNDWPIYLACRELQRRRFRSSSSRLETRRSLGKPDTNAKFHSWMAHAAFIRRGFSHSRNKLS